MFVFLSNPFTSECAEHSYTKLFQDNAPIVKYLAEFINPNDELQALKHQLAKRQTIDETSMPILEDLAFCLSRINDLSCSTGVTQGSIDADLSCSRGGGIEAAQQRANECAVSERGQFCSSAFTLFDPDGLGRTNVEGNCSGVLASDSYPSACHTVLKDFRSRLGCCINTFINGSRYPSSSTSVDYHVWNLCNACSSSRCKLWKWSGC